MIPVFYRDEKVAEVTDSGNSINVLQSTHRLTLIDDVKNQGKLNQWIRSQVAFGVKQIDIGNFHDAVDSGLIKITEERTTSSTGGQKGVKPERMSLIPREPLSLLARIYGFGEKKYAPHNYRKGYEWSKSYDALQRHLAAWWEREENDSESGMSHLGHAAFHVFALIVFSSDRRYDQFDDRYKPEG